MLIKILIQFVALVMMLFVKVKNDLPYIIIAKKRLKKVKVDKSFQISFYSYIYILLIFFFISFS
jgi:hypothetical protein